MARSAQKGHPNRALIIWSVLSVIGLSAMNFLFITSQVGSLQKAEGRRDPAILPQAAQKSSTEEFAPNVRWSCLTGGRSSSLTTAAANARIHFQDCVGQLKVLNKTNRSQAHLFPLASGQWTSDFINLSEGANQIQVEWNGAKQSFLVTRQALIANPPEKAL